MSTRFQTYELTEGVFGTYDTENEGVPTEYVSGPYDVTDSDAQLIADGAVIEVVDGQVRVSIPIGESV